MALGPTSAVGDLGPDSEALGLDRDSSDFDFCLDRIKTLQHDAKRIFPRLDVLKFRRTAFHPVPQQDHRSRRIGFHDDRDRRAGRSFGEK